MDGPECVFCFLLIYLLLRVGFLHALVKIVTRVTDARSVEIYMEKYGLDHSSTMVKTQV